MEGSEHELPLRDPRSLLAEADYWRALLEDLRAINDAVLEASRGTIDTQGELIGLMFVPAASAALEGSLAASRRALGAVKVVGERVQAIADLAEGRLLMLTREGGLES